MIKMLVMESGYVLWDRELEATTTIHQNGNFLEKHEFKGVLD